MYFATQVKNRIRETIDFTLIYTFFCAKPNPWNEIAPDNCSFYHFFLEYFMQPAIELTIDVAIL